MCRCKNFTFLENELASNRGLHADLIAEGINPFRQEASSIQASKMMIEMMNTYVKRDQSFAFETTLSGKNYVKLIPEWQKKGYKIKFFYLKLPDPNLLLPAGTMGTRLGMLINRERVQKLNFKM